MVTENMQPEEENTEDGLSDLFEVNQEEILDTKDVVTVDMDRDILDADEGGGIEDVVTVTEEDVMGDELYGQSPLDGASQQRRKALPPRPLLPVRPPYIPPPRSIGGLNA